MGTDEEIRHSVLGLVKAALAAAQQAKIVQGAAFGKAIRHVADAAIAGGCAI